MVFNLRGRSPDKIRKVAMEEDAIRETPVDKLRRAPWYIKLLVQMRMFFSTIDPFRTTLFILAIILTIFFVIGFILPWINVVGEVPNKIPMISLISGFTLGAYFIEILNKRVREHSCELAIGGKIHIADNQKVDILPGGEIIYLTNYYGKPLMNNDESKMQRYGKQRTIFIPKTVIEQFGSIQGRRARAYPDCRLRIIRMRDIDLGIMYIPKQISETRLLKKLETADELVNVLNETIDKYKENSAKIASDLRDFDKAILKDLVESNTALQEAFLGKFQSMLREEMYRTRNPYSKNRYGSSYGSRYERGTPPWGEVARRPDASSEDGD